MSTPLNVERLCSLLRNYVVVDDAIFLASGFLEGFRIPIDRSLSLPVTCIKKDVVKKNSDIIRSILDKEILLGRVSGPFAEPPFDPFVVTPIHVVPKSEKGKFRLIHNLSFPFGDSVNSRISDFDAKVQYVNFDQALDLVFQAGRNSLLAKFDVQSAFKIMPISPEDWHLLGFYFEGNYFFEKCLSFGLRCSCLYFERFGQFVRWLLIQRSGHSGWISYLDDFLIVVPSSKVQLMYKSLLCLKDVCDEINLPLASEKQEGPCTKLKFLGFLIDTVEGVVTLPDEKRVVILQCIEEVLNADKVNLHIVQSLAGRLAFVARIIVMGRPFIRSLYLFQRNFREPHHRHRLPAQVRDDVVMWRGILSHDFGPFRIFNRNFLSSEFLCFYTDAAPSFGFGLVFEDLWCFRAWPEGYCSSKSIAFLEFIPIVVSIFVWHKFLCGKKIKFCTDNLSLVSILNKRTSPDSDILFLLRKFVMQCVKLDLEFIAEHVPGKNNTTADALSRGHFDKFKLLRPTADVHPSAIPSDVLFDLGL